MADPLPPMTLAQLQNELKATGRYSGRVDGLWGMLTEGAILLALTDGPDTPLTPGDFIASGERLGVHPGKVWAMAKVEANGAGFHAGRPVILPEPHRFSRLTGHRFDSKYPSTSYPSWGQRPYPRGQDERYRLLLRMIHLDVPAGFAAASYGKFQILGENYAACGYSTPFDYAVAQARDEATQLRAFERFLGHAGILPHLRAGNWAEVARRYNGTAYRKNRYDEKLAAAFAQYQREHP
jgi:hypothetical protein